MELSGYAYGTRKISALKGELCIAIFCDDAIYFAHISKKKQKETSKMLSGSAKAEGKGLIGRTKAVMKTTEYITDEIIKLPKEEMLNANELNFIVLYEKIQSLKMSAPHIGKDVDGFPTNEEGTLKIKSEQKISMKLSKIYYADEVKTLIKNKIAKSAKFRYM